MIAYLAERFPPTLFLSAAAAISAAAHFSGAHQDACVVLDAFMSLLLIAQFRLWDDLADREHDRRHHPNRVLVRAQRTTRFVAICLLFAEINFVAAWLRSGVPGIIALGFLNLAVGLWYTFRPRRRTPVGDFVVLAKYPAFVLVLSAAPLTPTTAALWSALTAYAAACLYEIAHNALGPSRVTS
jgi:4-hydroxybenzoate polyprenyltransferase